MLSILNGVVLTEARWQWTCLLLRCHSPVKSYAVRSLTFERYHQPLLGCKEGGPLWRRPKEAMSLVSNHRAMDSDECLLGLSSKSFLVQPTTARAICFKLSLSL